MIPDEPLGFFIAQGDRVERLHEKGCKGASMIPHIAFHGTGKHEKTVKV